MQENTARKVGNN